MITKFIFDLLLFVPNLLLENMPTFSVEINEGVFDGLKHLFACIGFFPILQLMPILIAILSLRGARVLWALIIRIKSFIPTMGA